MIEIIKERLKAFDWKVQTYWNNPWIDVVEILSRIDKWFYKTKEVDIDLQVIDLSTYNFNHDDLFEFCYHYMLVQKANLKYPIILNSKWNIIDWRHRLCKAILQWKTSIKWIMITNSDVDAEADDNKTN